MSRRAERTTIRENTRKLTEQFQKQFHQNIPGPLSDFYISTPHLVHADSPLQSVPRALTSLKAMWLLDLRERPDENQQKRQETRFSQEIFPETECHTQAPAPRILEHENSLILGSRLIG